MGDDKSENNEVMWYEVYHDLAKLLANINGKELYEKCINNEKFQKEHKWFKSFTEETQKHENEKRKSVGREIIKSLDPMHVFASFNGFRMSPKSRTDRINSYFNLLGKENIDKEINFTGCPSPIMIKLIAVREEKHQKPIWESFKEAINNSEKKLNDNFINFDKLKECYGITIESFTVLLFWIDSKNFLPLDKNTLALFETNTKSIEYSSWKKYKNILIKEPTNIYQLVAKMAWKCTNELSDYEDALEKFGITKCPNKSLKIIAIKPLDGCNEKFLKGLKENEVYLFDKAYSINKDGCIEYHKEKDIQLFNQKNLDININAIVGKNGTGKSTLVELLLAVVNNVNYKNNQSKIDSEYNNEFKKLEKKENGFYCLPLKKKNCISYIEDLRVELIFEDLHIYRVKIDKEKVQYQDEEKDWKEIDKLDKKKFFYNILVNYSIHSLDSSENSWIEPYFKYGSNKNIVIEPFRKNGNINIQEEEKRVKERLLSNLLVYDVDRDRDEEFNFRQLTPLLQAETLVASMKEGKRKTKFFSNIYQEGFDEKTRKGEYNLEKLSKKINDSLNEDESIDQYLMDDFIDDIILTNDIKFSQLSSGEKQKIYSINSIVYHIQRLDKKKYKHINLILDEIELYFHPELQRTYINDIIKAINKVETDNILGVNITFITHSPFILSDIPESKILFLDKESKDIKAKTVPKDNGIQTFGANIHTLLSDSFFMEDGLMGEFSKNKIKKIVKQLNDHKEQKKLLTEAEQQDIKKVIQAIGEPFLNQKLWNMYQSLFNDTDAEEKRLNEEMARIQKKLESLKK